MSDGRVDVLSDSEMRSLGFTDHVEGRWYLTRRVGSAETVNFTINKATGYYDELVMDEFFGQPAFYGRMRPQFRDAIRTSVDAVVTELNTAGIAVAVNHRLYGVADDEV